jgi:hypothetical protein
VRFFKTGSFRGTSFLKNFPRCNSLEDSVLKNRIIKMNEIARHEEVIGNKRHTYDIAVGTPEENFTEALKVDTSVGY